MTETQFNRDQIALGIRQPWAELILRGIKTIEVRSQNTQQRGTISIYASKKFSDIPAATKAAKKFGVELETLPLGVVVGTVDLVDSRPSTKIDATASCVPRSYLKGQFSWELANPRRLETPLTVRFLPYGVWFYPWKRRNR